MLFRQSLWPYCLVALGLFFAWLVVPHDLQAGNISSYRDTISDSAPGVFANHTFEFTLNTAITPGSYMEFTMPTGFEIRSTSTESSTSTFSARNVELYVNGLARTASDTLTATTDLVTITPGSPGTIRYTLNSTAGIASGASLELRAGDHTSTSLNGGFMFSSSTGTTTIPNDTSGIINATDEGTKKIDFRVYDGGEVASAEFNIVMIPRVGMGRVDTTETIPPYRFNGSPTSSVGGTTLNVEISLETDELAICQFAATSGIPYGSASADEFDTTGLIFHSSIVPVTPLSVNTFYVRCIDDEGNFNTDDYIIRFTVDDIPTGTANTEGDTSGDGTGSGDEGTGDGTGSGGTTGNSSGETPSEGGEEGTGGSGGGGGGSSGDDTEDESGGGFESDDAPYESGDGEVEITGYAFPNSDVIILVDGNQAELVRANSSGSYTATLEEIARGVYTFGVYAIDNDDIRSSTFSTSFTVTGSRQSRLSNINVMPSILVTPDPVDIGETVIISGYSIPDATITIENQRDGSAASLKQLTTTSAGNGEWEIAVDTTGFDRGTYKVRAQAKQTEGVGVSTNFSEYTYYGVGQEAEVTLDADLNRDGSVNLTDFSILLFWWGTDGGASDPPADINRDGSVSLTDFSILLFNWTG